MMPINEWWIVAGFAVVTLVVIVLARLAATPAPAILYGNGIDDDAPGLRAWQRGQPVRWAGGAPVENTLRGCTFRALSDWSVPDAEKPRRVTMVDCSVVEDY